jgi:hypothetical protein
VLRERADCATLRAAGSPPTLELPSISACRRFPRCGRDHPRGAAAVFPPRGFRFLIIYDAAVILPLPVLPIKLRNWLQPKKKSQQWENPSQRTSVWNLQDCLQHSASNPRRNSLPPSRGRQASNFVRKQRRLSVESEQGLRRSAACAVSLHYHSREYRRAASLGSGLTKPIDAPSWTASWSSSTSCSCTARA